MKYMLCIDPGVETGLALFRDHELIATKTVGGAVDGFLEWWKAEPQKRGYDRIVIENFIVQPDFVGQPHSSEIIGAVMALFDGSITRQPRSDKTTLFHQKYTGDRGQTERNAWIDARFPDLTTQHERDAVVHGLVRLKRDKNMEAWRLYWA